MEVKIKRLDKRAKIPTYGTDFSAGADLYNMEGNEVKIAPGETVMIHLGIALEIPTGYVGLIFARSGLADGGERVAQISIVPYLKAEFTESDELSETKRGEGGFGSTGTK